MKRIYIIDFQVDNHLFDWTPTGPFWLHYHHHHISPHKDSLDILKFAAVVEVRNHGYLN